jgi:hypothetical protein
VVPNTCVPLLGGWKLLSSAFLIHSISNSLEEINNSLDNAEGIHTKYAGNNWVIHHHSLFKNLAAKCKQ